MPAEKHTLAPPRGMRDFYPGDMALQIAIFDAWRQAAEQFGFVRYDACVVESLELLKRKAGEEIVDQIYAFQDKSGRELALRPEMTPTLARMVAARQSALEFPLKWYAMAQCFRYERMTKGRKREHFQWNLDIIGDPSARAEVEVVAAALQALDLLGLDGTAVQVRASSRAVLTDLLLKLGIDPPHHAATFLALDKRGKVDDDEIRDTLASAGLGADQVARVFDLLGLRTLEDVAATLDARTPALADLEDFFTGLATYGLAQRVCFDISIVRGLAYYTGIVFEAFDTAGKFRAVFGGGRYDNLLATVGGKPETGVGLGFGDVVIAEVLADRAVAPPTCRAAELAVGYMEDTQQVHAARVAAQFRRHGTTVDLALRAEKPKAFFRRVGRGGYRRAAYLGPDDVTAGTVNVKNLETREQEAVKLTGSGE